MFNVHAGPPGLLIDRNQIVEYVLKIEEEYVGAVEYRRAHKTRIFAEMLNTRKYDGLYNAAAKFSPWVHCETL